MSNKLINIKGFSENNNQFVVKSQGFNVTISSQVSNGNSSEPSPAEFLLAGFQGVSMLLES